MRGTAAGAFLGTFGGTSANERVIYKVSRQQPNRTTRSHVAVISPALFAMDVMRCIFSILSEKIQKAEKRGLGTEIRHADYME